ncbi:MAG: hypothetical protein H0V89_13430 [Deltaproteobacteria bacterium]|nr:hypothetical protein [Deltaproteobacteria bacterium]
MIALLAGVLSLIGCATVAEMQHEPEVPERCRGVHLDRLGGDWVLVRGTTAEHTTRVRILDDDAGGYSAWYTAGAFTKVQMKGTKKPDENRVVFTEEPTPLKAKQYAAESASLSRLFVEPDLGACVLKVQIRRIAPGGTEQIVEKVEFAAFPKTAGVELAWQPATEPLFLGPAARDAKLAAKQMAELGEPQPDAPFGTVPVGTWSDAAADGGEGCTFDMDLWFDDLPKAANVAAGEVKAGRRLWYTDWEAPYSGNHYFEIHRFATCGGERRLLGIAAVSAVLM